MSNKRILVAIPTWKRPDTLPRALTSLVAQTHKNWEAVIAINGGSRDNDLVDYAEQISKFLTDPRFRVMILPENGLAYALNEAIAPYYQDYYALAVLEDDDEWKPYFLERMLAMLETTGADVVTCFQDERPARKQGPGGPMDTRQIWRRNWIAFPMCLIRSHMYERSGPFRPEAGPATDWDMHLRFLKAGARYEFLPDDLVIHHWHDDNMCIRIDGGPRMNKWIKEGFYDRYADTAKD